MTPSATHPEKWAEDPAYLLGTRLFNDREFWAAHEAWEEIWLDCDGIQSEYLQGLIQAAAALLKYQRGELPPALRLYQTAARRLGLCPDCYMGLDVRVFEAKMAACFQPVLNGVTAPANIVDFPRIELA